MATFIKHRKILFVLIVLLLLGLFLALTSSGLRDVMENAPNLKEKIQSLGVLGPLSIIGLMTIAIVMSPIPSAPIALAAGALYGHTWGTLYVLTGSTLGAIIAFLISRLLGYDMLKRWFGDQIGSSWVGSQNSLMIMIFLTRLMPFMSFDIISYLAGLTAISFLRFTVATIAGIAPASFVLAHFGDELTSADSQRIAYTILALGILVVVPLLLRLFKSERSMTGK